MFDEICYVVMDAPFFAVSLNWTRSMLPGMIRLTSLYLSRSCIMTDLISNWFHQSLSCSRMPMKVKLFFAPFQSNKFTVIANTFDDYPSHKLILSSQHWVGTEWRLGDIIKASFRYDFLEIRLRQCRPPLVISTGLLLAYMDPLEPAKSSSTSSDMKPKIVISVIRVSCVWCQFRVFTFLCTLPYARV